MFDQAVILPQAISTTQPMYRDIKFSREKNSHGAAGIRTRTLLFTSREIYHYTINPASVQNSRRVRYTFTHYIVYSRQMIYN